MRLTLAYSPCPNDCFMFDAIAHQRIDLEGLEFDIRLADVEALNQDALDGRTDVSKLSYHAFAYCAERYALLTAGSALGRGCGPILIARRPINTADVSARLRIAIPGVHTTAHLLLKLAFPTATNVATMLFSDIESAVLDGRVDGGVIIHENRFTYQDRGLHKVVDLGQVWEESSGHPIPLGGIVVRRSLPADVQTTMNRVLQRSVAHAFAHPDATLPYVRAHAQEMDDAVMQQHIALYVNDFSIDLGHAGREAVQVLLTRAHQAGVLPAVHEPVFVGDTRIGTP
jgi:1,4-dihydroxy-6-naphthoate synthase